MTRDDDEYERQIVTNVREHGCHIMYVFDPDADSPAFAYSTGFLESVGQPEVIVFGLPSEMMQFMINETLRQCRNGLELVDNAEIEGLLEGHRCVVCAIPPENITREYFNSAMWFQRFVAREDLTEACQIVWPGAADGLFPWEEGCSDAVRASQVCLFAEGAQ
ncbi:DUF4262 domain-containing protein [Sphingomonas sp. AP4-R1]|uniref:DUF4262 domain-containing protein n=1 Tax=Sphingomonas sp. AP4-R1 TaxID=2735134 RepID=UPI001493C6AF|nr:DUF4262 domain-containing protein [Sphingomonas sp. AP4-R1]QJU57833.1 DUF4262 domain-containing protein [Sphingomonas sp. AP4-R1]